MESDPENRPRPRRWLRWLSVIGLLMAVLVWLYFRDEALESADDLLPQRPSAAGVPDEENGWVQWQKVCDSLPEVPSEERARLEKVLSLELPEEPERDDKNVLSDEMLMKLEAALKLPAWTALDGSSLKKLNEATLRLNVRQIKALREGDQPEIMRISETVARLRQRIIAGSRSYNDLLSGLAARSRLPQLLARVDFSEAELERLAAGFVPDPCTSEDLHEVWRHEHLRSRTRVIELDPVQQQRENGDVFSRYLYQKNATANYLARSFRARLRITLESPFSDAEAVNARLFQTEPMAWANPNKAGQWFAGMEMTVPVHTIVWRRTAEHRCVRVLVALHRHWKATGALPDELSALVPRFLTEVPADPYDQKPLRWDKATRVVFAAGKLKGAAPPSFLIKGKHGPAGWFKLVADDERGGLGVRFRRPEEGPDVPVD